MSKQPFISIPFDMPNVRVLQTDLTQADEFILTVESTLTTPTCRRCGRLLTEPHGEDRPRLLRHLPILGWVVYLLRDVPLHPNLVEQVFCTVVK